MSFGDKASKNKNGKELSRNCSWTSQDLNILSQENLPFLSQDSQQGSQPTKKPEPLSLHTQQASNKLNSKMNQITNQRLADMQFIPQNQKYVETKNTTNTVNVTETGGFEMRISGKPYNVDLQKF